MSPTVHEFRNQIRVAVDRYERVETTQFTKESLAAIANAVGHPVDGPPYPSKDEMRAGIRAQVGLDGDDEEAAGGAFRKADLEAIAGALTDGQQ